MGASRAEITGASVPGSGSSLREACGRSLAFRGAEGSFVAGASGPSRAGVQVRWGPQGPVRAEAQSSRLTFGMMVWFLCGEQICMKQEGQEEPWVRPGQPPQGPGVRLSGQR